MRCGDPPKALTCDEEWRQLALWILCRLSNAHDDHVEWQRQQITDETRAFDEGYDKAMDEVANIVGHFGDSDEAWAWNLERLERDLTTPAASSPDHADPR